MWGGAASSSGLISAGLAPYSPDLRSSLRSRPDPVLPRDDAGIDDPPGPASFSDDADGGRRREFGHPGDQPSPAGAGSQFGSRALGDGDPDGAGVIAGPRPRPIPVPVMRHRWEAAVFLHWPYPVEAVQPHLPPGLRVEPRDGRAWVGMVLFRMHVLVPFGPGLHVVPPFPESNLRTYVVGPDGSPGIWFWSLDAASPSAVAAARAAYDLPYCWAQMEIEQPPDRIRYRSRRRWPDPVGAGHDLELRLGQEVPAAAVRPFDEWLTARFTLWNRYRRVLLRTDVEHGPWRFREAEVVRLREDLTAAAGLPTPTAQPLVHWSPGVHVRIGPPRPRRLPR